MKVIIFQGQYGIFKTDGLDLSMPAVQTCLGLYALSDNNKYILCAHFDTEQGLQENLQDIKRAVELKGIRIMNFKSTVFGGDGKQSYLRCTSPSSHIGNEIVDFIKKQGGWVEYSNQYYSGIIPQTFNFHYKSGCKMTVGQNPNDFRGGSPQAEQLARQRIRIKPSEYTLAHAKMENVSRFYS